MVLNFGNLGMGVCLVMGVFVIIDIMVSFVGDFLFSVCFMGCVFMLLCLFGVMFMGVGDGIWLLFMMMGVFKFLFVIYFVFVLFV